MNQLRVSADATADLDEIWLFIAQRDGLDRAEKYVEQLTSKFALFASMPGIGRARPELKAGCRSLAAGEFVIYYRHSEGRVTILRIIHGARDIKNLFE